LNLNYNQIRDEGALHLTTSQVLKNIKRIGLSYNPLGKDGDEALHRFKVVQKLHELHAQNQLEEMGQYILGDMGVFALLDLPYADDLKELDLHGNDLSDHAVIALAQSPRLSGLIALNLAKNNITDVGASALADSKTLTRLNALNLNFNSIGDVGAKSIARSQVLASLESLKLGQNRISGEGVLALEESNSLTQLIHPIFGFY